MAQLVARWLAVRQVRVRILARHPTEVPPREEVFMEGPLEPNIGPSLADVLLCTFESTNAGFSSVNNIWAFLNRKNNIGNHFQLSSFRTNQTRQKALYPKSLASLLLSHQHQPESDPYTTVYRCVWCAVSTVK